MGSLAPLVAVGRSVGRRIQCQSRRLLVSLAVCSGVAEDRREIIIRDARVAFL